MPSPDVSETPAAGSPRRDAPSPGSLRTLRLPEEVVRALELRMRGSSFDSVDALVAYILGRLVDQPAGTTVFSEDDERVLKERLRSLGYID
jgi:hypothetical protein